MKTFHHPYGDYDVLEKWDTQSWNQQTRDVIRARLSDIPERQFFSEFEWQTLAAVCDRIVPQPDRSDPIPIVPWIDQKLHLDRRDGYRYSDMPPLREAWRLGLEGIDQESHRRFGATFHSLDGPAQDRVLRAIEAGDVSEDVWSRLPPRRFFKIVLLPAIVAEYYSHPAAWNEAGFGGPASPRGYVRTGFNERDPWEARALAGAPDDE
jgi:hypothetical protein